MYLLDTSPFQKCVFYGLLFFLFFFSPPSSASYNQPILSENVFISTSLFKDIFSGY